MMKFFRVTQYLFRLHSSDKTFFVTAVGVSLAVLALGGANSYMVSYGYAGESIELESYGYIYAFSARVGYIIPLVLGALIIVSELRSGQIIRTILISQSKRHACISLSAVSVFMVSVVSLLFVTASFAITATMFQINHQPSYILSSTFTWVYLRILVLHVLWATVGIGLGWLIRRQSVIIGIVLSFAVFIEPTISAAANQTQAVMNVVKWMPGPLNWSVSWPPTAGSDVMRRSIGLDWWQSLIVMSLYAISLLLISIYATVRKDVAISQK